MKSEQAHLMKRNLLWAMLYRISGIFLPFLSRTVMIYTLGNLYLGLNGLFTSIINIFNLAELGIGSAMVYSMYRPMAEGDTSEICSLLSLYKRLYQFIGLIILGLGILFLPFLHYMIKGEIPSDVNLHFLYVIYLSNSVLSYLLFSYRQSVFWASQKVDIVNKILLCCKVLQHILQCVSLLLFSDYYLYLIVLPFCTLLNNIFIYYYSGKLFPQYTAKGCVSSEVKKDIKKNIKGLVLTRIGATIRNSTDNLLISSFLGLALVGIYTNYYTIVSAVMMLFGVITSVLIPAVGNAMVKSTLEENYKNIFSLNMLYMYFVSIACNLFLCLAQPFLRFWAGEQNMLDFSTVVLFTIYIYSHTLCDMLYVHQEASGFWWHTRFVSIAAAVVNFVISILLIRPLGINGVIIGTILSLVIVYYVGYGRKIFTELFKNKSGFKKYTMQQLYFAAAAVSSGVISYYACQCVTAALLPVLMIGRFLICGAVSVTVLFFFYRGLKEYSDAKSLFLHLAGLSGR